MTLPVAGLVTLGVALQAPGLAQLGWSLLATGLEACALCVLGQARRPTNLKECDGNYRSGDCGNCYVLPVELLRSGRCLLFFSTQYVFDPYEAQPADVSDLSYMAST